MKYSKLNELKELNERKKLEMTIGPQLKQARISKGISLEEASAKTKIQEKFLSALENDNLLALPNTLYLKGFLKKYAEFLGLDQSVIISQLEKQGVSREEQVIILANKELPPARPERYFKKALIAIVALCVLTGAVIFLFSGMKKSAPAAKQKVLRQKKSKIQPAAQLPPAKSKQAPKPVALPQQQPAQAALAEPLVFSVVAKKPCRLSLKSDARLLFEGFLLTGTTDKWQAKKSFEVSVSDGSALEMIVNGRKVTAGQKGTKRDLVITKDGIRRK